MSDRQIRNQKLVEEKYIAALSNEFKNVCVQPKIILKRNNDSKSEVKTSTPLDKQQFCHGEKTVATSNNTNAGQNVIIEHVPQMTSPVTIISSVGEISESAKELLQKSNTDFMVVGVIGTQGVGKSTILNLLANEKKDFNYYSKVFVEEDFIFSTKLKSNNHASCSRTESIDMFITSDRLILLDTPPLMTNAYKKDVTNYELDDLTQIVTLMSVCHLLIIVMDDYFNMNFFNLLRSAELMKGPEDVKPFHSNYYPNVLFIKNHAKRWDYTPANQINLEEILEAFFKDSQLRIHHWQIIDDAPIDGKNEKCLNPKSVRRVNVLLFPEIESENGTAFHAPLNDIVKQLRGRVFHTPRNQMCTGQLTEELWFNWLSKISYNSDNFFFRTYEDVQRKHLNTKPGFKGIFSQRSSNSQPWRKYN